MIELRHYQKDLKNRVYKDWSGGAKNVLNVLSTGGGKSVILSDIVLDGYTEAKQQVVIAHRNELVSQLSGHVADRGIYHRIIGSDETIGQIVKKHREKYGKSFVNLSAPTAVAGVDTIISRQESLKKFLYQTDRFFGDEAHHFLKSNKWGKAVDLMPNAQGLGVTATPERADGQGLGFEHDGIFHTMQVGADMRSLINEGSLAEYEIVCPRSDLNVDDIQPTAQGDWSAKKLKVAAKKSRIVGDAVEAYLKYAFGKRVIVFATDVETSADIARKFNEFGVRAVSLSGKTPANIREKYVEEFRAGLIQVLVNVDLFDEGFDVPACDVVIMARPTASLGKYLQMIGRCLRPFDGKEYGLIIDLVSNVVRHDLPDKLRFWTLERRDKRAKQAPDPDEIPMRECTTCTKPYRQFLPACPYCGTVVTIQARSPIEQVQGDLILLDRSTLEKMRQAMIMETPASIGERCGKAAGKYAGKKAINDQFEKMAAQQELKEAIAQWGGIERSRGFSDQEIYRRFYLTTGCDMLTALDASQKRQDFEKLTETVKGWYT